MSIKSLYPDIRPSLNLDFANSKALDGRITFTRNSTATYVGANGLIQTASINGPRFDHDPVTGESLGLLIEEARTNLYKYSDQVFVATSGGTTATANTTDTLDPAGGNKASKISRTSGYAYQNINSIVGNNVIHTLSFWIKYNGQGTFATVGTDGAGGRFYVQVNWTSPVTVSYYSGNANTTGYGISLQEYPNGWYRVSATFSGSGTPGYQEWQLSGSGTDEYFIYGYQVEAGAFPTSYIPTSGSSVTRGADFASITGTNFSSWYNSNEVSVIGEYSSAQYQGNLTPASYPSPFAIDNTSTTRLVMLYHRYDNRLDAFIRSAAGDSVADLNIYSPATSLDYSNIKFGFAASNSGFSGLANDGSIITDTSVHMPPDVNRLVIGGGYGSNPFSICGSVKRLHFYSKKLTNAQLQILTQ